MSSRPEVYVGLTSSSAGEAFRIERPLAGVLSMVYAGTALNSGFTISQGIVGDILSGDGGTSAGVYTTDDLSGGAPVVADVPLIVNVRHSFLQGNFCIYITPDP